MPTTITPASPPTIPASLSTPADGEPCNSASVDTVFQAIESGLDAERQLLHGGGIRRRVTSDYGGTVTTIQPLGAVLVQTAGTWEVLSHLSPTTVNSATLSGGFAANTRYWLYAYDSGGGTLAFAVSTTAPDAGMRYMSGNLAYLYVSTLYTDAFSSSLAYAQVDGSFSYESRTASGSGSGNLLVDGGAYAGSYTPLALSAAVPVQASIVTLHALMGTGSVGPHFGVLFGNVNLGGYTVSLTAYSAGTGQGVQFRYALASGRTYAYQVGDAVHDTVSIWVAGFDM